MSEDEKQILAFARVLLQRPQWLVVNGAFDKLDGVSRERIENVLAGELSLGVVNIASGSSHERLFTRTMHLLTSSDGPTFRPADHCANLHI
jgi:putative ATP-binding cassette transporter